ncbi:MAG: cell envelope integrity protein CreD [Comamonadaceae bacterium]|nr:MAG: cell envelope integrity protein CreD [Comamonadaceae bacterium]
MLIKTLRHSALAKVAMLILLLLLLCIPLGEIGSLVSERRASRDEAAQELAATHAGAQTLTGPLLLMPWTERWTEVQRNSEGKVVGQVALHKPRHLLGLPEQLRLDGQMAPESRYRGIFEVLFYKLDAKLAGRFPAPTGAPRPSEAGGQLVAGTPVLAFALSDVRGIVGMPQATLGGVALKFQPGLPPGLEGLMNGQGIHAPLPPEAVQALQAGQPLVFDMALQVIGQDRLHIVPLAEDTQARIQSPWPHPSFGGRFLASERTVTDAGFDARWQVSSLTSDARAQLMRHLKTETAPPPLAVEAACAGNDAACRAAASVQTTVHHAAAATERAAAGAIDTFAVSLAQPVDVYVMAHRAAKYGALIIALVLMGCFMVELFRKLRLHPIQYGLVGLSIALFFLLLVALSEKLSFWQAYALSACASVGLLMAYFSAVLRSARRGLGLGAFVGVLYAALFGLLASESNALLLGALLTFGMLAALMLLTRNVDWYALSNGAGADTAAPANATTDAA